MDRIDASQKPPIYYLRDLMEHRVPGTFYKQELHKASAPDYEKGFWKIEKVLKTKRVKGKKWEFVKFLGYPAKFNDWVEAT